jgi:hypothetical protein
MKNMDRVIVGGLLVLGMSFGLSAQACSTDGWDGGAINTIAGSPPPPFSRYSELCAMKVSSTGHVQSTLASDTQYIGRFYVFPDVGGSGEVDLLLAYSDDAATSPLFTISFDGSNFNFDATDATGTTGSAPAKSGWNLVEFEYNAGGNFNVWVNAEWTFPDGPYVTDPTDTFASGSGTVESVRLGAPNGMGGFTGDIYLDAYESHRTTNVGALIKGDANKDGFVNTGDIGTVITEFFAAGLATGTPDCNEDGLVNTGDIGCVITIFFTTP